MTEKLLEMKNISKAFGTINAVKDVNFYIGRQEIVALLGDNGAGKSTLIKTIAGVHKPDTGEIYWQGRQVDRWDVHTARLSGIETVFQDKALAQQQSITTNIFMGRELTNWLGFINYQKQHTEAERLVREIGFTSALISPHSRVGKLSGGEQQGIAIARALYFRAELILLDEPTTALSLVETNKVFTFSRKARDEGSSILFISHNIYHAWDLCDRFIILDRGTVVLQAAKAEIGSTENLVRTMEHVAKSGKLMVENQG
jgi:simple sugar transport system ATP-binding protein